MEIFWWWKINAQNREPASLYNNVVETNGYYIQRDLVLDNDRKRYDPQKIPTMIYISYIFLSFPDIWWY